jgi:hypothetical protein
MGPAASLPRGGNRQAGGKGLGEVARRRIIARGTAPGPRTGRPRPHLPRTAPRPRAPLRTLSAPQTRVVEQQRKSATGRTQVEFWLGRHRPSWCTNTGTGLSKSHREERCICRVLNPLAAKYPVGTSSGVTIDNPFPLSSRAARLKGRANSGRSRVRRDARKHG